MAPKTRSTINSSKNDGYDGNLLSKKLTKRSKRKMNGNHKPSSPLSTLSSSDNGNAELETNTTVPPSSSSPTLSLKSSSSTTTISSSKSRTRNRNGQQNPPSRCSSRLSKMNESINDNCNSPFDNGSVADSIDDIISIATTATTATMNSTIYSNQFQCFQCSKKFDSEYLLDEHMKHCDGSKKRHECSVCKKRFFTPSHLDIHFRIHTGHRPFSCSKCSKAFTSLGALKKHLLVHSNEKQFTCEKCGQSFTLKGTLNRHMKIHTGVKPHKCQYCGKEFIQSGGLKAHLFFHTGENGFQCDQCGRQFNRKARLEMHKKYVHDKIKPFRCMFCEKAFTRQEDLNRHLILHSGEKKFICQHCDKRFAFKASLNVHLLTHRVEPQVYCSQCNHVFIRLDCLIRHIRKVHKDIAEQLLANQNLQEHLHSDRNGSNASKTNNENFDRSNNKLFDSINAEEIHYELVDGKIPNEFLEGALRELLKQIVHPHLLRSCGWPQKPLDTMLDGLLTNCKLKPITKEDQPDKYERLRDNVKLVFFHIIEDDDLRNTLNETTVDSLIVEVIQSPE